MPIKTYELSLDLDLVVRSLGSDPERARPRLRRLCATMIERARSLLAPAVAYEIVDVQEVRHDRLVLSPRVAIKGPRLVSVVGGAEQIAVAVCTIGPDLEQAVSALFASGRPADATVLDGVGSAAVEELSQRACREIETIASKRHLTTSIPLSPGDPDFSIEEQRTLLSLSHAEALGVTLNDSLLMQPLKSLSLVVGIGRNLTSGGSPCEVCTLKDVCRYRAMRDVGHLLAGKGQRAEELSRPV
jgi:hypothetical protein